MAAKSKNNVEAFSLSPLLREYITALIETGHYSSRSDVVKDALRVLIESKPHLAISIAIHLYKKKIVSVEEAASLSKRSVKEFLHASRRSR